MENSIKTVIIEGLLNELESAESFLRLSKKVTNISLMKVFIDYAKEELIHMEKLYAILENELNIHEIYLSKCIEKNNEIDLMSELIQYLAKEESTIFYYKMLISMINEKNTKNILSIIKDEEKIHYNFLKKLIEDESKMIGD